MNQDINKKLENVLNGMDKDTINSGKKLAEQILSGKDGEKALKALNNIDKNKLLDAFMNIDDSVLKEKLQSVSNVPNLNVDEILKKLR